MMYHVTHSTKYSYSEAVPVCHNLVHLAPRNCSRQFCHSFRLLIHPEPVDLGHRVDFFGNHVSYFSIDQAHLGLTVTANSRVKVSHAATRTADDTPKCEDVMLQLNTDRSRKSLDAFQFIAGSPSIKPLSALAEYARPSFTPKRPILDAVLELTARIHEEFSYDPRATTIHTPVEEVFEKRHGVCQDFAQLQIGCIRALGLSARYVSGYLRTNPPLGKPRLVGADESHAWLSVYCGSAGWIDVDPTNNVIPSIDHITLAWGRDYNDICPIQGVFVGGGEHRMQVSVDVAPDDSPSP